MIIIIVKNATVWLPVLTYPDVPNVPARVVVVVISLLDSLH